MEDGVILMPIQLLNQVVVGVIQELQKVVVGEISKLKLILLLVVGEMYQLNNLNSNLVDGVINQLNSNNNNNQTDGVINQPNNNQVGGENQLWLKIVEVGVIKLKKLQLITLLVEAGVNHNQLRTLGGVTAIQVKMETVEEEVAEVEVVLAEAVELQEVI